ncbi:hypothetical protein [Mycolicibacterium houstonense]|uniref:phage tail tube protein n=1 Tax=Mycolicibacterium houstonense TaxID=146021 RepID=UPI000836425B|nr:hypothetical protein [Mycolicibacterium houstonense]
MAQNDDAVLLAAVGYVYTAPVGTPAPTPAQLKTLNPENPASWPVANWESTGHTSEEDLPEFGFDGGDTEVRGSWQKKKLREITTEEIADFVTVNLNQFDETGLSLYYGANQSATPGVFGVRSGQVTNERAFLIIIVDGDDRLGFHSHKASLRREDAISLATDEFGALPVRATFLDHEDELLYTWINEDWFNVSATPVVYTLDLGAATGGSFVLDVNGVDTAAINFDDTDTEIRAAIAAVDDGLALSAFTVTAAGADFDITSPVPITVATDNTTGGTGVTVTVA